MRKIEGWPRLRTAVIALGLIAWTATGAMASPTSSLSYTTSGQVDTTNGVTGTNVISIVPLSTGNSVDLARGETNLALGMFVLSPLADGASTSYANTPFKFSFLPASYNGVKSGNNDSPVVLTGTLSGVASGASTSTVKATFDPISKNQFSLGTAGMGNFSLPDSIRLVPSTTNNGMTSAQDLVTFTGGTLSPSAPAGGTSGSSSPAGESAVPEPSTIALFLTTLGGLGLRRYVQSRRRQASI